MTDTRRADQEMVEGYIDGFNLNNPEPSSNRSASYRHGFQNGRDDRRGTPRATAEALRKAAQEAMDADETRH